MAKAAIFDTIEFWTVINRTRQLRHINWADVAEQSGVSASTLTRLGQGRRPDADTLASLCAWAGVSADPFFIREEKHKSEPMGLSAARTIYESIDGLEEIEGVSSSAATLLHFLNWMCILRLGLSDDPGGEVQLSITKR